VRAALGLHRRLAQQVAAARESGEELVVEVVAVGEDDEGWVLHGRALDDAGGVEEHGEAFAGALGVPDDAGAAIAGGAVGTAGADCFGDGGIDGVELVVAGDDFVELVAIGVRFEGDEVLEEIEEALLGEDAADEGFEFEGGGGGVGVAFDGAPDFEPFAVGGEGADAGFEAVGEDEEFVVMEEGADLVFVGLELVEGAPDGGAFIGGAFEFDDGEGEAVQEDDDIGAAGVGAFGDGELIDGDPVVGVGVVEIDEAGAVVGDGFILAAVFDGDAVAEEFVELVVSADEGGGLDAPDAAEGVGEAFFGDGGVEALEGVG